MRFKPVEEAHATFKLDEEPAVHPALIMDESYSGCSLVALEPKESPIAQGQVLTVKVGPLHEMPGEVKWVKRLELNIVRFGVEYL